MKISVAERVATEKFLGMFTRGILHPVPAAGKTLRHAGIFQITEFVPES